MRTVVIACPDADARATVARGFDASWRVVQLDRAEELGLGQTPAREPDPNPGQIPNPGQTQAGQQAPPELLFVDVRLLTRRERPSTEQACDALARLLGGKPRRPVVLLTPPAMLRLASAVVRWGASTYLTLPVDLAEVTFVTDSLLHPEQQGAPLPHRIRSHSTVEHSLSPLMQEVLRKVHLVAPTQTTVLLTGETGVGKSTLARLIHALSNRSDRQFIAVHCGAIPDTLLESELFGHERGAFTGAIRRKLGKFEVASGGTVFLDEVGLLTPAAQIRLLGVIQERCFQRVGGETDIRVNVRVVAATNIDLRQLSEQGSFRRDLFYRLNVFPLEIPPLRERREDLPQLVQAFLERLSASSPKRIGGVEPETMQSLMAYDWPGNVRELENLVERAFILESGRALGPASFPAELWGDGPLPAGAIDTAIPLARFRQQQLEAIERQYLEAQLTRHRGSIKRTAAACGVGVRQLHKLLCRHGLDKERFKHPA